MKQGDPPKVMFQDIFYCKMCQKYGSNNEDFGVRYDKDTMAVESMKADVKLK